MEKIKLSSYGKKQGNKMENSGNNYYETDSIMVNTETRLNKYRLNYLGKPKRIHSRLKKYKSLEKILPRLRPPPKFKISMNC